MKFKFRGEEFEVSAFEVMTKEDRISLGIQTKEGPSVFLNGLEFDDEEELREYVSSQLPTDNWDKILQGLKPEITCLVVDGWPGG